jgi:uncharacterized membrane protein
MFYTLLKIIAVAIVVWAIGSYVVVRTIEKPAYTVLEKKDGYEIRQYDPYIVAQTTVSGDYDDAMTSGFRIIADYIFGNNTKKENIAMTSPVLEKSGASEKIAMTVPVLERANPDDDTVRTVSFVLPAKYTLDTLPVPNNNAVVFVEVPARKVAASRFTWYASAQRMKSKKSALQEYLKRDGIIENGPIETARYNPPASMPLMLRNEVLIPVQ